MLWVAGYMIGPHRAKGRSPYGDDRVVGVANLVQIGGELGQSAVGLLDMGHRYAASGLLRQLVEVEYLMWWYGGDRDAPLRWLRASPDQLRKEFAPARLRERAGARISSSEYVTHCAFGGHPNPRASRLLPGHSPEIPVEALWADLALHLVRLWDSLLAAVEQPPLWAELVPAEVRERAVEVVLAWRELDGALVLLPEVREAMEECS